VLGGLYERFTLLDAHYRSDIERLAAVEEAGALLDALPLGNCPICGAEPEHHRSDEVLAHYNVGDVRAAAAEERAKTERLRADLLEEVERTQEEVLDLERRLDDQAASFATIEESIETTVKPALRAAASDLAEFDSRRDARARANALRDQIEWLESQLVVPRPVPLEEPRQARVTGPSVGEMQPVLAQVERVLAAWQFPYQGHLAFSEQDKDLVLDGESRSSHGKGVRALTCAAFIVGLMQHCRSNGLPHPGVIVLDSPLVAYRDPDPDDSADQEIRLAGVSDALYRSLAAGFVYGQVIVLENEQPPTDLAAMLTHHHFSKSAVGRYGFFPR
jgi:hypothetical protein